MFLFLFSLIGLAWLSAYLAVLFSGCFMFLGFLPQWTWTVVLLVLTVATMRGFKYSPD